MANVAQLVRASDCGSESRGFKSRHSPQFRRRDRYAKPVRKCHECPLNLEDHCWRYASPRDQWRGGRTCPGFDSADLHRQYQQEKKQAHILTRRELRREMFRARNRVHTISRRGPRK